MFGRGGFGQNILHYVTREETAGTKMPGSTEYTKDTMLKQDILNSRRQAEVRAEGLVDGEANGREEGRIEDREEGLAEGEANGREEGRIEDREEGLAEGEAKGREEGRAEGKIAVALNLKAMGLPMADITKATGLTAGELQQATAL